MEGKGGKNGPGGPLQPHRKPNNETGCLVPSASDNHLFTQGQSVHHLGEAKPTHVVGPCSLILCPQPAPGSLKWTMPAPRRKEVTCSTPFGSMAEDACPEASPWQAFMQQIPLVYSIRASSSQHTHKCAQKDPGQQGARDPEADLVASAYLASAPALLWHAS